MSSRYFRPYGLGIFIGSMALPACRQGTRWPHMRRAFFADLGHAKTAICLEPLEPPNEAFWRPAIPLLSVVSRQNFCGWYE